VIALLICVMTAGCMEYRKSIESSAVLNNKMGYIYGRFKFGHKYGALRLSLCVTDTSSGEKYYIRFAKVPTLRVIEVPPGQYKITHWALALVGATMPGESSLNPYEPLGFSEPFRVEGGQAYYIGDYVGSTNLVSSSIFEVRFGATIDECVDRYEETTKEIKQSYPNMSTTPMNSIAAGVPALIKATQKGDANSVKLLLEKGEDVNAKVSNNDSTALIIAAQKGDTDIIKLLLNKGADVNAQNKNGDTPLVIATQKGDTENIKLLLEKDANVNAKTYEGKTVLIMAALNGQTEIVKLLLEKDADVNMTVPANNGTALMVAAWKGHIEIVKLLLEKGADVNAKETMEGLTALTLAALNGHTEVVKLLLEKGADVNVKANNGETALWAAKNKGHKDIVQLLKNAGAKE